MCGIFGGIGEKLNPGTIRALALINRERGTHSVGFFDNTGKMWKAGYDPLYALGNYGCGNFIDRACYKGWFIAGHTRHATTGAINRRNAHPFRFGRIIGAHNGCVTFPRNRNYRVDSQYLFDLLNKHKGDYQTALEEVSGYWGLSWFDGCNFWLQAYDNEIAVGFDDEGNVYYSSDYIHLEACVVGMGHYEILKDGNTLKFAVNGNCEFAKPFVSRTIPWGLSASAKSKGSAKTTVCLAGAEEPVDPVREALDDFIVRHKYDDPTDVPFYVRNGDDDWCENWDEYSKEYE